jgi:hypothetical protein
VFNNNTVSREKEFLGGTSETGGTLLGASVRQNSAVQSQYSRACHVL